jgi:hypothetical protein
VQKAREEAIRRNSGDPTLGGMPAEQHNAPAEPERTASAEGRNAAGLAEDDSARLLRSLYASFSTTYLTLTSVIQGVALVYLVGVVDNDMHAFGAAEWILVVATFLMIVAAWHEYMTAVTVFVWIPRLPDSLIPFLLGGAELVLIRALGEQTELQWFFLAMAVTSLLTVVAFLNMYASAGAEREKNRLLLENTRYYEWLSLTFAGCSAVLFLLFSAVEARATESGTLDVVLAATTLALVVAFLARSAIYWNRVIDLLRTDDTRGTTRAE